jgi:hypothetical protein
MARRPKLAGLESSADLARKLQILEEEMATQREALDKLKQLGLGRVSDVEHAPQRTKRTA